MLLDKTKISSIRKTVANYLIFLRLFMIFTVGAACEKKCDNEKNVIRNFVF